MSRTRTLVTAAIATVITAAPLAAQSTASASLAVTGKIVTPIALAVSAPLDFGAMFAATAKTIAPDASTSGRFNVSGEIGAAISVTLQMPTSVTSTGGASIPLSNWNYMVAPTAALTGATAVSFSPTAGIAIPGSLGDGHLYFGVGATATPPSGAAKGVYSATGQITVAYVAM